MTNTTTPVDLGAAEIQLTWNRVGYDSYSGLFGTTDQIELNDYFYIAGEGDPNGLDRTQPAVASITYNGVEVFTKEVDAWLCYLGDQFLTQEMVDNPQGLELSFTYTDSDGFLNTVTDKLDSTAQAEPEVIYVSGGTTTVEVEVPVEVLVPVEVFVPVEVEVPTADGSLFTIDASTRAVDQITNFNPGSRNDIGGDELLIVAPGVETNDFTLDVVRGRKQLKEASTTDTDFIYRKDKGLLYWNANGDERGFVIEDDRAKLGGKVARIDFADENASLSIVDMVVTNELI